VRIRESKMGNGRLTIDLQLKKRSSENSRWLMRLQQSSDHSLDGC
jgi:hypothetical protein